MPICHPHINAGQHLALTGARFALSLEGKLQWGSILVPAEQVLREPGKASRAAEARLGEVERQPRLCGPV